MREFITAALACAAVRSAAGRVVDFGQLGAIAGVKTLAASTTNGALLNKTLAVLEPLDTLLIPNTTFYVLGGVRAVGLRDVALQVSGSRGR